MSKKSLVIVFGCMIIMLGMANPAKVYSGEIFGFSWPNNNMTFHIGDLGDEFGPWQNGFQVATSRWNSIPFNMLVNIETTSGTNYCESSGNNGVQWSIDSCGDDWGENTLAVTQFWSSGDDIIKADILFNDTIPRDDWSVYDGPWRGLPIDFRRVAIHEIGHAIGLDHSNVAGSIMQATLGDNFIPQEDDIETIIGLYGNLLPPPQFTLTDTSGGLNIAWQTVPSATHYEIYQCRAINIEDCNRITVDNGDSSYVFSNIFPGTVYQYRIKTCQQFACSDYSAGQQWGTLLGLPAVVGISRDEVRISWERISVGGYDDSIHYEVYSCTSSLIESCGNSIGNDVRDSQFQPLELIANVVIGNEYYFRYKLCDNFEFCGDFSDSHYWQATVNSQRDQSIVYQDFNGDGFSDLLIRNQVNGQWLLYQLNGNTVLDEKELAVTNDLNWQYLSNADLNNDGKSDLLVRHTSGLWYVYFLDDGNVIGGTLISATSDVNWQYLASADYNNDGNADLLLRHSSGLWYVYYLNEGEVIGGDLLPITTDNEWHFQTSVDFNDDGNGDILIRHSSGAWYLYLLDGGTVFIGTNLNMTTDLAWTFQGASNFSSSNEVDLLLRHNNGSWYVYSLNGVSASIGGPISLPTDRAIEFQFSVTLERDLYGDIQTHLVLRDRNTGQWQSYFLNGTNIRSQVSVDAQTSSQWTYSGQVRTSFPPLVSKAELLLRHDTGYWFVTEMDGFSIVKEEALLATSDIDWSYRSSADFNNDGNRDLLLRHTSGLWYVYFRDGSTINDGQLIAASSDPNWVFQSSGDYNGDGNADLLLRHSSGLWYVYYLDGASIIGADLLPATTDINWQFQSSGDHDGDGKADLLVRHNTGLWYLYSFDGSNIRTSNLIDMTTDLAWTYQSSGDFNGDGKADLLVRHESEVWHLYGLNGNEIISSERLSVTIDTTSGFASSHDGWIFQSSQDFDGDGLADVLLRYPNGIWSLFSQSSNGESNATGVSAIREPGWIYQREGMNLR